MTAATELAPVVKRVEVDVPLEEAFRMFTEELGSWWPMDTHSIGEDEVSSVIVEGGAGGRIYERWGDGTEYDWARFTAWEPPARFVMDWRPNPEPGPFTEVEVTFTAAGSGTLVELQHRGWERLGEAATKARAGYDTGWGLILGLYERAI